MTSHPDLTPDRVAALRTSLGLEAPAPEHAPPRVPPDLRGVATRAAARAKRAIRRVVRAARERGRG